MKNKQKINSNLIIIVPVLVALIACVGTVFKGAFSEIAKALLNPSVSMTNSNPADEAVIKFVVLDKSSNTSMPGATIILQIDVMPSETNVTDTDGVARFFLKPETIGLHGFLQIEADGYKSQKRDIDIDKKKPLIIYLEKENSISIQPTPSESNDSNIENFIILYFDHLNMRDYQLAWLMLSDKFKANYTYDTYVSFWDTVEKTEMVLVDIKSSSSSEANVYTEVRYYYKNGVTTMGHTTYKLVKDSLRTSWLIDPN